MDCRAIPDQDAALMQRLDDLAALGGSEKVVAMLARFADQLEALLATRAPPRDEIHRMIGLAGIFGFAELEHAWRPVEDGEAEPDQLEVAHLAAKAAIRFARAWTARP